MNLNIANPVTWTFRTCPFAQTNPDRLAVIGHLLGLRVVPPTKCRVLEIGCAAGGNLIPMACQLPGSQFVGFDLSKVQIDEGVELVNTLALKNIELQQISILDVTPALGKFDYIISHGVYSWVPPPVQEKILNICKTSLNPHGLSYLSYNTYQGWHMRGMIRDMLFYHASQFTVAAMKVRQARNLLDFLGKATGKDNTAYAHLLKTELESFRRSSDSYLYHEHLEEHNEPIYFYQFAERAAAAGLRYLGEADLRVMVPGNFPPEVESVLQMLA